MANRPPRFFPILLLLTILVLGILRLQPAAIPPLPNALPTPTEPTFGVPARWGMVERAVDGDTILLVGGERVRLLGVNTPETTSPNKPPEPFGPEASAFTSQHVQGRQIRLEFDVERFDKYGRTLAYVYIDELFLNEALIAEGLGRAQLQYPYRSDMKRRFAEAERSAKEHGRGIWRQTAATLH